MTNYNESTRQQIANLTLGLHVQTPVAGLGVAEFTNPTQTELFDVYGRIAIQHMFIELSAAADANATTVAFNCTFTVPVIAINVMNAASASIASIAAGGRIVWQAGVVATTVTVTDSAGLTDADPTGARQYLGGIQADGTNVVGSIGMAAAGATQAAVITANAHIYYVPMAPGSYVESAL